MVWFLLQGIEEQSFGLPYHDEKNINMHPLNCLPEPRYFCSTLWALVVASFTPVRKTASTKAVQEKILRIELLQ